MPSDVGTLREMVLTLLAQIDDLHGQMHYLKRQLFGRKSETLDPNQRLLFEDLYTQVREQIAAQDEQETDAEDEQAAEDPEPKRSKPRSHPGRKPLPEDLPREVIEIEPSVDETVCPDCHCEKDRIGSETTEKLEYRPASFYVKQYVRYKYACRCCEGNIAIGLLPPMAIEKGLPGEGLLAHILTSKYADHAPLNRLETIIQRHGIDITVSTMCDWVGWCADLLDPLVRRMHERLLLSPKIHSDDTTIPVKNRKRKGSTDTGYLWVYLDDEGNVVFDFTPTRSREGPLKFLGDYAGYVQADAYSGYDEFFRTSNATEVGCHAHARRKFQYALDSDPLRAATLMALWGKLYAIERRARNEQYSPSQLYEARQTEAGPILDRIKTDLDAYKTQVLPKSPIGKAVGYALNQWPALTVYLDDPILSIDNNVAERTLRGVVIGRKNYLFAGSAAGARRAAVIYSLVAACKFHTIDPFAYFQDVLARISTHPASRIDELLPGPWKVHHQDHPPEPHTDQPAEPAIAR